MEVLSQIIISFELGYITKEESFRIEISKIANKLNSLRKSSLNPVNK
jgi:hypothetical protein